MVRKTMVVTKVEYYLLAFFAMCYCVDYCSNALLFFVAVVVIGSAIGGEFKKCSWPLRLLMYVPSAIFAAFIAYYAYSGHADDDYGLSRVLGFLDDKGGYVVMYYVILGFFCREMLEQKNKVSRFLFRNMEEEYPADEPKDGNGDDA